LKTHSTIHAKAILRDPATTKKMVEEYTVNGHTFEALGIPYAGFVFDAIQGTWESFLVQLRGSYKYFIIVQRWISL